MNEYLLAFLSCLVGVVIGSRLARRRWAATERLVRVLNAQLLRIEDRTERINESACRTMADSHRALAGDVADHAGRLRLLEELADELSDNVIELGFDLDEAREAIGLPVFAGSVECVSIEPSEN